VIDLDDILAARERIASYVRRTPVLVPTNARDPLAPSVFLKLECLQVTGSFKARGAMNRVLTTPHEELGGGIVTASGGNHGLAVARTAYVAGVPATVFLPSNVSPAKVEKLKGWQARVEIVGDVWDTANEAALAHAGETGALYLHPFADPLVVAGQGTLALDLLEDVPDFDVVLIAIGGGGLIAGMATALKALRPKTRILGIEPTGSPTLKASFEAGEVVTLPEVTTSVPTMACRRTDERIFELVRDAVHEVVLVTDEEMREAARWLWFEAGIAADLSGAAALAALRTGRAECRGAARVCALVCGAGPDGIA
jgi:threonine dehydratase